MKQLTLEEVKEIAQKEYGIKRDSKEMKEFLDKVMPLRNAKPPCPHGEGVHICTKKE